MAPPRQHPVALYQTNAVAASKLLNKYLYVSAGAEAAGIPEAADISDACLIDDAFELLSPQASEVHKVALQAVTRVTEKRLRRTVAEDVAAYLCGNTEGDFRATLTQL